MIITTDWLTRRLLAYCPLSRASSAIMARLGAFWHNWRVAAVLMCLLATKIWRLQAQQHTLDITICIALSLFSDAGGNLTMIHPALVGRRPSRPRSRDDVAVLL